jgi:hypothetical protein
MKLPSLKKEAPTGAGKSSASVSGLLGRLGLAKPSQLLVVESDGFVLRGGVVNIRRSTATLVRAVETRTADPSIALDEVCDRLKADGKNLPKRAIMMAPGVVSALLDLPVGPGKPRPAHQMQELIRWELDPYFSEYNDLWTIGAILQSRGYLTADKRHELAVELELRHTGGNGGLDLTRFGELAMEFAGVTREQLDECLEIQERMVSQDVTLACGWAMQQWGGEDGEAQSAWQVCGTASFRRKQWVNLFAQNGVKLEWFFPRIGGVLPLLCGTDSSGSEQVLLEIHQEQLACFRVLGRQLVSMHVIPRPSDQAQLSNACIDLCSEHMRPDVHQIVLHECLTGGESLHEDIAVALGRDVVPIQALDLPKANLDLPLERSLHLISLAEQAIISQEKRDWVALEAVDPPPPLWKDINFWRYALPGLLAVSMVVHGVWSYSQLYNAKLAHTKIEGERKQRSKLASSANQLVGEAKQLGEKIKVRQAELELSIKELDLLENVLIQRKRQVPQFLRGLARSVNSYVVVDEIRESINPPGFLVEGWAARDTSGHQFAKQLEGVMMSLGYMVAQTEVRAAQGRTGVKGYGVSIWMIPIPPEELEGHSNERTISSSNKTGQQSGGAN